MKQHGLSATEVTLNSIVSACEHDGKWQAALLLCKATTAAALRVDAKTHNAAILACAVSAKWLCVLDMLNDLSSAHYAIDSVAYASAIDACGMHFQQSAALLSDVAQATAAEVREALSSEAEKKALSGSCPVMCSANYWVASGRKANQTTPCKVQGHCRVVR